MDLKKMPPSHGYNYICNIVDCYRRFAFGGCIKHKTAKEVATVILRFIYIFGPPRILQTDNGKEFNNEDLTEVMAEFKTRKINGKPYHPQSQGRVERFNRTVVAYFRTAFVDSRDWPSMLDEFYYKYNSRVNKSTKPLTPYQRFYKRPNFCVALEDQVPICNLTSEEKAFLNSAHLDVEDNVETEELTVENTEVNENSQEQVNDSSTTLQSAHIDRVSIVHVPACAHMDDLSIAPVQERQLSNQEYMENMWRQKLEKIAPVERRSNIYNETPLTDTTNSQMVRNTDMTHGTPLTDTSNSQIVCNTDMTHGTPLTHITNSQMVRNTDMMLGTPLTHITNSQMVRNTDMTHGTPLTHITNSQMVRNTDMMHGTPLTHITNSQMVRNTDMTHGTPLTHITNSQMVRNTDMMHGTPLTDTTNSQMVRNTDMTHGTPLTDTTNSQMVRNTDMMHGTPLTDTTNSQIVCNTDMTHGTPLTHITNSQMVRNTDMTHGTPLTHITNSQMVRNTDMMHGTPLTHITNSQMVRNTDMTHGTPLTHITNSQMVRNTDMMHGTPLTDTTNSQMVRNTDMMLGTPLDDITNSQMVRNTDMMLGTPLTDTTNSQMVRNTDMMLGTPLADITNSQIIRNTDMMHNDVSPYYREIYAKRFLANTIQTNSNKRRYSDSNIYTENRETWDRDLYPVELFPRKSQVIEMQTFNPNINDTIDFRPNSALSARTNVFLSGYWRKGIVMDIQMDDSKGRVYTVKTLRTIKSTVYQNT
ncbi:DEP domain-containing protein DDB_G0279099-like [Mytilus edulis]|uniref:DEP domain-containing protein DDB_G0279099-like n=1 Tax=Mytilus edulis TaxID=6550 RepID=UPI0039F07831